MPAMPGRNDGGCIVAVAVLGLVILGGGSGLYFWMIRRDQAQAVDEARAARREAARAEARKPTEDLPPESGPVPAEGHRTVAPPPATVAPRSPRPARVATAAERREAVGAPARVADPALLLALEAACARKAADPAYVDARGRKGIPREPDRFPGEAEVKRARAAVAAAATLPRGVRPLGIPRIDGARISVDGRLSGEEWDGALELPLDQEARVLLGHDGRRLLFGVEAPADRTAKGYDQFRLHFHLGLSGSIVEERLHLSGDGRWTVLREVRPRTGGPAEGGKGNGRGGETLTDWNVLEKGEGATTVEGHRRYEGSLDLAEAGLPAAAPFPLYLEIEGDPVTENGKFRSRVMVGVLGASDAPLWFRLEE